MAVPSPSPLRQERAARRGPEAPARLSRASLTPRPARRASRRRWPSSSLPHLIGARVDRRLSSAPGRDQPAADPRPARRRPARRPALVRRSRRADALARGAGDRAEPVGRAAAGRRGRGARAGRGPRAARRWPTGAARGSATARAITTAPSPICARRPAGLHHRPRLGRPDRRRADSGRSLGRAARRDRDAEGMDRMRVEPSWRQPAGIALILLLIVAWARAGGQRRAVARRPAALAARRSIYLVAGIVWILPLKPLLRWMETGRLRRPSRE